MFKKKKDDTLLKTMIATEIVQAAQELTEMAMQRKSGDHKKEVLEGFKISMLKADNIIKMVRKFDT